jgi:hypothetical protein
LTSIDDLAVLEDVAYAGHEDGALSTPSAGLDDDVGSHGHQDLLKHPDVERTLAHRRAEPIGVLPRPLGGNPLVVVQALKAVDDRLLRFRAERPPAENRPVC